MPSKKVKLKRTQQFIHEGINSPAMQENLAFSKMGVGSYFKEGTSTLSGHGLEDTEVNILLPGVIGIQPSHPDFSKAVDKHYQNMNTIVPYGKQGKLLEIGLKEDNNQPISSTNMPLNIEEFLRFRHAVGKRDKNGNVIVKGHPQCAYSDSEAEGNSLIKYFIEDPTVLLQRRKEKADLEDQAVTEYLRIKKDINKVKMVVSLLAKKLVPKPGETLYDPDKATDDENILALKDLSAKVPNDFIKFATDGDIARKYFINKLLILGIIQRNGDLVVDGITRQPIGKTLGEVVTYIYNPSNIAILNDYKTAASRKGVEVLID